MKNIGIVILATNTYFILGIRFIKKFMEYYVGDSNITFYFFSDLSPKDYIPDNYDVIYFPTQNKTWIDGTNLKFISILSIGDKNKSDYLFYFDADTNITQSFTEEWFLGDLVGGQHYGDQDWMKKEKAYDRNPKSKAYIPFNTPLKQMYFYGAFFGGTTKNMLNFCQILLENQIEDKKNNYEPAVNDESYINQYFHYNPPTKVIHCNEFKFNISDKGGIGDTRNLNLNTDSIKNKLKQLKNQNIDISKGKVIYNKIESSFELVDTNENLSVCYQNLYFYEGEFIYITTNSKIQLPAVNKWTDSFLWKPRLVVFESNESVNQFVNNINSSIELAVYCDMLWISNIGHTLWDGLYPIYLALIKFGYINDNFTVLTNRWENKKEKSFDFVNEFSGNPIIELNDCKDNFRIKKLVSGTGQTGVRIMNPTYTLYGSNYNGPQLFKERLYKTYGLTFDEPINESPKIIVIDNKRFSDEEKQTLLDIVKDYQNKGYNIKYIYWQNYKSLKEQFEEFKDVDIQITAPGTAISYTPFLKKGAVNINLGWMERTQTNTARPNIFIENTKKEDFLIPSWMEQSICAAANQVSTLFFDRQSYNIIDYSELSKLIDKSINMVKNKIVQTDNHNHDAKVFIEYCQKSPNGKDLAKYLTDIAYFIEFFIYEHPQVMKSNLVDKELLRKLKNEYKINRKYDIIL